MSRKEYLDQLAYLLQDIPEEERTEALEFYRDYFEEAGEDQEEQVISTLGSPEKVAAQIKSSLAGDDGHDGTYTETGYRDERFSEDNKVPVAREEKGQRGKESERRQQQSQNEYRQSQYGYGPGQKQRGSQYKSNQGYETGGNVRRQGPAQRRSGLTIALIVVICIMASPLLLSLLGVAAGVLLSILAVVFSVAAAAIAITLAALVGGVALLITGISALWISPAVGFLMMGGAMIALAIGILMIVLTVWIAGKFVPWALRGIVNFCSRIFRRGGRRA